MEDVIDRFSEEEGDVTIKPEPCSTIVFDEVHIIQEVKEEPVEKSAPGEECHDLFNHELTGTSQSVYCNTCWAYCKDVESLKEHQEINPDCKQGFQNDDNSLEESCKIDMLQTFDSTDVERSVDVNPSGIRNNSTSNIKAFVASMETTSNIKSNSANKCHMCHICNKSFAQKSRLNAHILIHAGESVVCSQAFTQKGDLNKYKLINTDESPFTCDLCNRTFARKSNLNSHRLLHKGEKAFTCDVCDKTFSEKNGLNRHKLRHAGERPFTCSICNKTFTQNCDLNSHKLIHTGQRPFTCSTCNKTFTQSSSLNRHKLVHTGERPFVCDICNKTFNQKSSLNKHKLLHTGERTIPVL